MSVFDPDSGFCFETDSQKNETSLRWILWIRISKTALTNMADLKPNQNETKTKPSETETDFRFCKSGFRFCD